MVNKRNIHRSFLVFAKMIIIDPLDPLLTCNATKQAPSKDDACFVCTNYLDGLLTLSLSLSMNPFFFS